jgi:hypothetical protein
MLEGQNWTDYRVVERKTSIKIEGEDRRNSLDAYLQEGVFSFPWTQDMYREPTAILLTALFFSFFFSRISA